MAGATYVITLRWLSINFIDGESTSLREMAQSCQATSHYLCQCWLSSIPPYGITRPQWVQEKLARGLRRLELLILTTSCFTKAFSIATEIQGKYHDNFVKFRAPWQRDQDKILHMPRQLLDSQILKWVPHHIKWDKSLVKCASRSPTFTCMLARLLQHQGRPLLITSNIRGFGGGGECSTIVYIENSLTGW